MDYKERTINLGTRRDFIYNLVTAGFTVGAAIALASVYFSKPDFPSGSGGGGGGLPDWVFEDGASQSPNSFLIYEKGRFFARNGDTGKNDFSGTNEATVIQNAINSLVNGGLIHLKTRTNGSAYIADLNMKDFVTLEGDGWFTNIAGQLDISGVNTPGLRNLTLSSVTGKSACLYNNSTPGFTNQLRAYNVWFNSAHSAVRSFYNVGGDLLLFKGCRFTGKIALEEGLVVDFDGGGVEALSGQDYMVELGTATKSASARFDRFSATMNNNVNACFRFRRGLLARLSNVYLEAAGTIPATSPFVLIGASGGTITPRVELIGNNFAGADKINYAIQIAQEEAGLPILSIGNDWQNLLSGYCLIDSGVGFAGNHTFVSMHDRADPTITNNGPGSVKIYRNASQGIASVTVGTSPFTYTNNDNVPEAIYIRGGTVSDVSKNATTIFAETGHTVWLEPGEAVVVTYSVIPTILKDRK